MFHLQACGDIEKHFQSEIVEPQLIVFDKIVQQFVIAEREAIIEVSSTTVIGGIVHLMAAYYVFDVGYPSIARPTFFFMQDVVMDKCDGKARPVRYTTFIKNAEL